MSYADFLAEPWWATLAPQQPTADRAGNRHRKAGPRVRCTTVANLVSALARAASDKQLGRPIKTYGRVDLLRLGERGCVILDWLGAETLFQIFTEREVQHLVANSSNTPFAEWNQTFTDKQVCRVIVDRLIFEARIIGTGRGLPASPASPRDTRQQPPESAPARGQGRVVFPLVHANLSDRPPADYADVMSPSGRTRLTEAREAKHRLAVICRHVIRRPLLILALVGLAVLIIRFSKDFPVLYGIGPLGAVLITVSMSRSHPTVQRGDDPASQDVDTD
ncbi:ATP-binding protein [Streptomyces sp. NPDC002825]|uniref:ATP-binding protein n=1 Tax=Streptomyces sp. NPDC002825 TaxID=3154666 RepID=UPI00331E4813